MDLPVELKEAVQCYVLGSGSQVGLLHQQSCAHISTKTSAPQHPTLSQQPHQSGQLHQNNLPVVLLQDQALDATLQKKVGKHLDFAAVMG